MKRKQWVVLACAAALFLAGAVAQVLPPGHRRASILLDSMPSMSRVNLSHNSPEAIRRELLDPVTLRVLAQSRGLSKGDLESVTIAQERDTIELYQVGRSDKAFEILSDALRDYVRAREEGHTKKFLIAAITNRTTSSFTADRDLRVLLANRPLVPASSLRHEASGTITNKAGLEAGRTITTRVVNGKEVTKEMVHIPKVDERCRWVSYTATDGEIAWRYLVQFKANGSLDYIREDRCDAKEIDPKYQKVIKAVENEIEAQMKKSKGYGQLGSCHTFWHLKKEKLRTKGIDWHSPAELNPNTRYD